MLEWIKFNEKRGFIIYRWTIFRHGKFISHTWNGREKKKWLPQSINIKALNGELTQMSDAKRLPIRWERFEKQIRRKSRINGGKHVHSVTIQYTQLNSLWPFFFSLFWHFIQRAVQIQRHFFFLSRSLADALNSRNGMHFPDSMNANHRRLNTLPFLWLKTKHTQT